MKIRALQQQNAQLHTPALPSAGVLFLRQAVAAACLDESRATDKLPRSRRLIPRVCVKHCDLNYRKADKSSVSRSRSSREDRAVLAAHADRKLRGQCER